MPPPPAVESKACFEGKGLFTRVHASTARRPRSPSMPGPSGMPDVMLSMFVVLAVAEEVESLNRKLYDSVVATLERAPAHAKTLIWPMGLAVRAQCALEMARSPVAELLGRVIDAALSAGGDGRGFKPWATLPLQAECRPPRPTLVASSHGATCARFGASSASATASTGQPACTAESAASAPDMPRNLSLSSAWAAVITMLARAAWWRSDGKMGSTCAAPATQPATPHKYRESAPSKSLLGSAVGTMLFCAVTLNFSVLSPEAALSKMQRGTRSFALLSTQCQRQRRSLSGPNHPVGCTLHRNHSRRRMVEAFSAAFSTLSLLKGLVLSSVATARSLTPPRAARSFTNSLTLVCLAPSPPAELLATSATSAGLVTAAPARTKSTSESPKR